MPFVREEIPSKFLRQYKPNSSVENIFTEINLRSKKWFLSCSYNPNLTLLNNHIQNISRVLDFYSSKYDNFIVLGVFCKKGVLRNFTKFIGKHLCQSLFFNKVAGPRPTEVFSCEFCEISRNTFSHRTPLVAASGILMLKLQTPLFPSLQAIKKILLRSLHVLKAWKT